MIVQMRRYEGAWLGYAERQEVLQPSLRIALFYPGAWRYVTAYYDLRDWYRAGYQLAFRYY
jgi:hypothetical protein